MNEAANHAPKARKKDGFVKTFKKNLPLTLMALPALIVMFLFRYLPMVGLLLSFKRFSVRKGIFGSDWVGLKNFEFLFTTSDAWVITRNTLLYNALFILLDLILAVVLSDHLHGALFLVLGSGLVHGFLTIQRRRRFVQPPAGLLWI